MVKKSDDYKIDIRALKLNLVRGEITSKEYEAFLKSLPDLSGHLTEIPACFDEEEEKTHEEESNNSGGLTFSVA